ncbi:MAG TPA: methionine--tRNA ligase [Planctomycetes bacterium]|nr:methionine--tRNA ligase [Planctomycetota bacterium]
MTRTLVTSALPYANGPIHFGHAVGAYLPADCYVRTLRMLGEEALFVCGTDEHGFAITVGAENDGVEYPEYVARWRADIKRTFDRLGIEFDVWSGTSISPHHTELAQDFFRRLSEGGFLIKRASEQLYCPKDERFLADRYVLGTCYVCGAEDARGDECGKCGTWLDATRLVEPRCRNCGSVPEKRSTTHWYLDLPKLRDAHIGEWFQGHPWKANVKAFVENMLADLEPRPITRDMGWGVPVPEDLADGETGKVLYVWFDAPIGYISFTREWADAKGEPELWKRYWKDDSTRLVHFIGKDNIPFHCLIFPSMLWGQQEGYVLPWQVPAMEFYNLQGRKFSTSRNWTIPLDAFFETYDAEATRFYLLSSAPEAADSEWRWEEFQRCVNTSLADTIGNLATRVLRFVAKHHEGRIPAISPGLAEELDRVLLEECGELSDPAPSILEFRFRRATQELIAGAAVGNVFIDREAPWALRKSDPERSAAVLNTAIQWLAWIARAMVPFMPAKAQDLWEMLGGVGPVETQGWPGIPIAGSWRVLEAGTPLGQISPPFRKLTDEEIEAEVAALEARAEA